MMHLITDQLVSTQVYVYDGEMIHMEATDEFLLIGGYLGASETYPSLKIFGYSVPDDEWSVKGSLLSRRIGAFSVRIIDDNTFHIIGGNWSYRTSETCRRTDTETRKSWIRLRLVL